MGVVHANTRARTLVLAVYAALSTKRKYINKYAAEIDVKYID